MERMKKFYTDVFNWKMQQLGPEMGDYVVVHTTETDEKNMVQKPGTINGGFYKKTEDPLSKHPSVVIMVEDIRAALQKVTDAGGTVIGGTYKNGEPDDIPGVGLYASIIDTEGNRVSIMQPHQA